MDTEQDDAHNVESKGKRFELTASERRCLELQLAPVERLRAEAARLELRALLEVRAFAVERLGLPEGCQVRVVRTDGIPVALEIVEPHAGTANGVQLEKPTGRRASG